MLARMSHPMHTYLLGQEKNQSTRSSANARKTKQTQEIDCQSLDLRQTPHKRQTWKPNANCWTYIRLRTNKHTQETDCQSLDLRQTPTQHKGVTKEKRAPGEISSSPAYVPHLV